MIFVLNYFSGNLLFEKMTEVVKVSPGKCLLGNMFVEFRLRQKMRMDCLQLFRRGISIWWIMGLVFRMEKRFRLFWFFHQSCDLWEEDILFLREGDRPGIKPGTDRLLEPGSQPLG